MTPTKNHNNNNMGRAPCCDKANVKRGPWSPEEDAKLKAYIESHGTGGNWIALPQKIGLKRCGKSCRLRWLNYLRPNLKHGGFSEVEDNIIYSLYINIGSRWSVIAGQLPGRTDNDIKNYWNTRLKKKFLGKQQKKEQARRSTTVQLKKEQQIRRETHHYHHHHDHTFSTTNSNTTGIKLEGMFDHHQQPLIFSPPHNQLLLPAEYNYYSINYEPRQVVIPDNGQQELESYMQPNDDFSTRLDDLERFLRMEETTNSCSWEDQIMNINSLNVYPSYSDSHLISN